MVPDKDTNDQLQCELERLNAEIEKLHCQLRALQQEKADLEIMLEATTEHGDQILQNLMGQKADLEILLEATTEHSDSIASELQQIAREERRQREEQFQLITEATPVGLAITQIADGTFLYANEMMGQILGVTAQDLLNRRVSEFYSDFADCTQVLLVLQQSHQFQGEVLFRRSDETRFWALLSLRPFVFQQENTILIVIYDIDARKKAEEALRLAEQKYRSIFENALEGIYQSTPDGNYVSVNPAFVRMMGYSSEEEMLNANHNICSEYVDEADRENFKRLMAEKGTVTGLEYRFYTRDGDIIWLSESARAVRDEYDNLLYYEGIIEDITNRKQIEEALQVAEAKYRSIFENAVEGIFRQTPEGQYIDVNPAMATMYGFQSPQEMCQEVTDIFQDIYVSSKEGEKFKSLIDEQGEVNDFECRVYRRDKTKFWISEWARAIRDTQGQLLYYEGSCIDITKRKQEEGALKQQLRELQIEIDQNKREREVASIVATDYFQELQEEIEELRSLGYDDWSL